MENIKLFVKIKVNPKYRLEVYSYLKALHKLTHEFDDGCIEYDLYQVTGEDNHFCFIETWENQEALDKHTQQEHYKNFMEYIDGKVDDVNITFLNKYKEQ